MSQQDSLNADLRAGAVPLGRGPAVAALVAATRERLLAGLALPAFGKEPADFLAVLRRRDQP